MKKKALYGWSLFLAVLCLVACSRMATETNRRTDATIPPSGDSVGVTDNPEQTPEPALTATSQPLVETPLPSVETAYPGLEPAPDLLLRPGCPTHLPLDEPPLWEQGSVIFRRREPGGIWAISADDLQPHLVYDIQSRQPGTIILSEDGAKLRMLFEEVNRKGEYRQKAVIYDFLTQKETTFHLKLSSWSLMWRWLPDGTIQYLTSVEQIPDWGEKRVFQRVSSPSGEARSVVQELELPQYLPYRLPAYQKIASISPDGVFALYVAAGDEGFEVVLHNLQTNSTVWRQPGDFVSLTFPPPVHPTSIPQWHPSENSVLFSGGISDGGDDYGGIFRLMLDGKLEPLVLTPFPFVNEEDPYWAIEYMRLSPEGRYLNYR